MFKGKMNKAGRPKGSLNSATASVRDSFSLLVSDNINKLQADIDSLEPYQRIKIILELGKFIIPTLKATDLTIDDNNKFNPIEVNVIQPEEIKKIMIELNDKY